MEGRATDLYLAPALDGPPPAWSTVPVGDLAFGAYTEADDPISRTLADGIYPAEYSAIVQLLKLLAAPGSLVLDLGAHIGIFSLAAAAAGYRVIAVEASPRNAALLAASAARNGFDGLRVIHAAISDRPGMLEFCAAGPYGHVATGLSGQAVVRVPAITVDGLLERLGCEGVNFVKVDIEGSEVAALDGMARLLAGPDEPPVYYESNGHTLAFFDQSPTSLKTAFESRGYRNYIPETGRLVPVAPADFQPFTVVDYLALKQVPPALRTWRIDKPLPMTTVVARVLSSIASANPAERLYIARSLAQAPRRVRANPQVRFALASLHSDPHEPVREAASAIATPSWRDWLGILRGGTLGGDAGSRT